MNQLKKRSNHLIEAKNINQQQQYHYDQKKEQIQHDFQTLEKQKIMHKIQQVRKRVIEKSKNKFVNQSNTRQKQHLSKSKTQINKIPETQKPSSNIPTAPTINEIGSANYLHQSQSNLITPVAKQSHKHKPSHNKLSSVSIQSAQKNSSSNNLQNYLINIRQQYIYPQNNSQKNSNKKTSQHNKKCFTKNTNPKPNSIELSQSFQQNLLHQSLSSNFLQSPTLSLGLVQSKISNDQCLKMRDLNCKGMQNQYGYENGKKFQSKCAIKNERHKINLKQELSQDKLSKSSQTLLLLTRSRQASNQRSHEVSNKKLQKQALSSIKTFIQSSKQNNSHNKQQNLLLQKYGKGINLFQNQQLQNLTQPQQLQNRPAQHKFIKQNIVTSYQMQIEYLNKVNLLQSVQIQKLRKLVRLNKNCLNKHNQSKSIYHDEDQFNQQAHQQSISRESYTFQLQHKKANKNTKNYKYKSLISKSLMKDSTSQHNNVLNPIDRNNNNKSISSQLYENNSKVNKKNHLNSSDTFSNKKTTKKSKKLYQKHNVSFSSYFTLPKNSTTNHKNNNMKKSQRSINNSSQNITVMSSTQYSNKQNFKKGLFSTSKSKQKNNVNVDRAKNQTNMMHSVELFSNTKKQMAHLSGVKKRK